MGNLALGFVIGAATAVATQRYWPEIKAKVADLFAKHFPG